MNRINQLPTNYKYVIEAAKVNGYTVSGLPSYEQRQDCVSAQILFAGTLADALDYIRQEIIKHDEWRDEGPTQSMDEIIKRSAHRVKASSPIRS